jgi:1-hydroxycarotenoid 3,4-desaturase
MFRPRPGLSFIVVVEYCQSILTIGSREIRVRHSLQGNSVVVIGAGIGGLAAAIDCAVAGFAVTLLERQASPGGKLRAPVVGGVAIDAGPTVFTMRAVFEALFADAGASLDAFLTLRPAAVLARHAWPDGSRLDLFADIARSAAAIGDFAGAAEARGFLAFCARARAMYTTLDSTFIRSQRPTPLSLVRAAGLHGLGDLWRIAPFETMWRALGQHFRDPRLRQLFGRYATYCGSSPFLAPATLMLVAHVEQDGVWFVDGGMHRLAQALAALAAMLGVTLRCGAAVERIVTGARGVTGVELAGGERIAADAVVVNADPAALAAGLFGADPAAAAPRMARGERSLSAITWALHAQTAGFPLLRHNVFFSADYAAEFDALFRARRLPREATIYVCAQDRGDGDAPLSGRERLLCLVNAPADGDVNPLDASEIDACTERSFAMLARNGLRVSADPAATAVTTPRDFAALFPATGGALYGPAVHGAMASFRRPQARSVLPGIYLAGGATHPGAGVPMAALSGRLAAAALIADRGCSASTGRSAATGMRGGMSMR